MKFKPQYRRLLFIDRRIREVSYPNCASLAREWEVSGKTIQRDIDYLKYELDAPIEYDKRKRGYYYTEESYRLPAVTVSESDLFAVCIAERALQQFQNTPLYAKLASVFAKIQQSLPEKVAVDPAWVDSRILVFPEPTTAIDPGVWETIAAAIRENRQLRIAHKAPAAPETTVRIVDPYYLVNYKGEWYLTSFCHKRQSIRTFAVSRIQKAEIQSRGFTMPFEYDVETMFGDRFGIVWKEPRHKVRIRFSPVVAPYIMERQWHPLQTIRKRKDGGIVLEFVTNHVNEVKDWVLSWGAGATILSPPELVRKVRAELEHSLENYTGPAARVQRPQH